MLWSLFVSTSYPETARDAWSRKEIMFKFGGSQQVRRFCTSEGKWYSVTQPESLWRMFASTLISTAYTGKSSFTPSGTPRLNQSRADYGEYSVSWSQQDSPASMPCQVSSLNLIAAILTSIPWDAIIIVCKYTSAYVKHAWASQEEL